MGATSSPEFTSAASRAVNLLITSAAICTAFSSLSSLRFRSWVLCCLCLLASLIFSITKSNWWSVSQSALGYVRQFINLVQLKCSLSYSNCHHQERSRYTAALDVVWTWYWLEPTPAQRRSLLAAHQLHSFLLSHPAQLQMTLQTVVFCRLWRWSYPLRAAPPFADLFNC